MPSNSRKSRQDKKGSWNRLLPVIMVLWIIGMGGYVYFVVFGYPFPLQSSLDQPPIVHVHVRFEVILDGENITHFIPAGIGVSPSLWKNNTLDSYGRRGIAPISTELPGGVIHIELTRVDAGILNGLVLKDFFNIWGKELTVYCIEIDKRYCTDTYDIRTFINDATDELGDPETLNGPQPDARLKGKLSISDTSLIRVYIQTRQLGTQ